MCWRAFDWNGAFKFVERFCRIWIQESGSGFQDLDLDYRSGSLICRFQIWIPDSRSRFQILYSRIWKPDLQICSFFSPRDLNWSGSYDGATKTWGWGCLMCFTSDPIKIFCNDDWALLNEKLIDLERICVLLVQRNESRVNTVKIARLCLPPLSQQGWTMFSHCFKWFHMLSYA